jgi:O-antigen/teichoic acid export membrane protein
MGRKTSSPLLEAAMVVPAAQSPEALRSRIVSGSLTLLAGSGLVGGMNLVYNLAVARLLGPVGFAHATAVYTLLMLMSAITLSFQVVCAKLVANHESPGEKAAVYAGLHRKAWGVGIALGLLLIMARSAVSSYLNLPDPFLIVVLGLGTAFYIPLGARRGCIQGTYAFRLLSINLILEGLVRLGGAYLLIKQGMGVNGAVLSGVAAVIVAYFFAMPGQGLRLVEGLEVVAPFREGLQAIVFFAGQVIINNFDIVLVKHFFPAEQAGLYAAVALVGRLVNMCAWAVVSTMFPVSAGTRSEEHESRTLLITSLFLVLLIVTLLVFGLWLVPSFLWNAIFGAQFELSSYSYGPISSLLILYAMTTGIYCFSSVIIAYEMSRKIANTGWVQLAYSGALVLAIYWLHATLLQVILVQLALMLLLLFGVLVPILRSSVVSVESQRASSVYGKVRKRGSLTQEQIIAEFLKNEFHHPEFDQYRDQFEALVNLPDFNNPEENNLRRALLFLRRGAMWRELPDDTQWFEVELSKRDLGRIRVFPRAQWRRIAQGSFYLTDIAERIRAESDNHSDEFFGKLRYLSTLIQAGDFNPTVLLIGVDESGPLTILDGNHRIAAAMLAASFPVRQQFRFICGFSPRMTECCWYQTNVTTLWRYAKNLVKYMPYDPESDIGRFLEDADGTGTTG